MSIEIFIRLPELELGESDLEYPEASTGISFPRANTHFTIWGSPEEWENLSRWAHECAEARSKALADHGRERPF